MWLIIIPVILLIFYLFFLKYKFYKNTKEVKFHLEKHPAKKIMLEPSKTLKRISNLITFSLLQKIFSEIKVSFIKRKIFFNPTQKYNIQYYLNLVNNNTLSKTYFKHFVPKKYWNYFLIEQIYLYSNLPNKKNEQTGLREGIVKCYFHFSGGNKMHIPYKYNMRDTYFLLLFGNIKVNLNPSNPIYYEGIPYLKDYEEEGNEYGLRSGDFLFVPAGTIYKIRFQWGFRYQMLVEIQVSEFQNLEKDVLRTQILQNREIKKKFKLHLLSDFEKKYYWKKGWINSGTKDKNLFIDNPMYLK